MTDEIKNGSVKIHESDLTSTFASRSDLVKYGIGLTDLPKYMIAHPMGWAQSFAQCMLSSGIVKPKDSPSDVVSFCLRLADEMFEAGKAKKWITPVDMEAIEKLEAVEPESDYSGIAPGRK